MTNFPLREPGPAPSSLARLAELLDLPSPDFEVEIRGIASLAEAGPDQLGLLADRRYVGRVPESRAGALLVSRNLAALLPEAAPPALVVEDAHLALVTILESLFPAVPADPEIHPTAVLGKGVRLGARLRIGPYAVIEEGASIGDGVRIGAHAVVGAGGGDRFLLDPPPARRPLPGHGPREGGDRPRRGTGRGGRVRIRRGRRPGPEGAAGWPVRHRGRRRDRGERHDRQGLDRGDPGLGRGEARQPRPPRPQRVGRARRTPCRPRRGRGILEPGRRRPGRGGSPASPGTSLWAPARGSRRRRG